MNQLRALAPGLAGVRQTGIVTYSLLRWAPGQAHETMNGMKPLTSRPVDESRIKYAETKLAEPCRLKEDEERRWSQGSSECDFGPIETELAAQQLISGHQPSSARREAYDQIR